MNRRSFKLTIYCGAAICTTAISGLNVGMFGDGTLDWPHFRFAWTLFLIGVVATVFTVLRAALDQDTSATNPPTALVPVKPPEPVAEHEVIPQPEPPTKP
jgi:Na+/melibiose symporter-like transporter